MSTSSSSTRIEVLDRNVNYPARRPSPCVSCTPCCCGMSAKTGVILLTLIACIVDSIYIFHIGFSLYQNFFGAGSEEAKDAESVNRNLRMDAWIPFPKFDKDRSDEESALSFLFYLSVTLFSMVDLGMSISLIIAACWEKPHLLIRWVKYCFIILFLFLAYFVFHISEDSQTYNSHFWFCLGVLVGYCYLLILSLCLRRDIAIKRALAEPDLEIPLPATYRYGTRPRVEQDPGSGSIISSNPARREVDGDNNNVVISVPRSDFAGLIKTPDYSRTPKIRVPS